MRHVAALLLLVFAGCGGGGNRDVDAFAVDGQSVMSIIPYTGQSVMFCGDSNLAGNGLPYGKYLWPFFKAIVDRGGIGPNLVGPRRFDAVPFEGWDYRGQNFSGKHEGVGGSGWAATTARMQTTMPLYMPDIVVGISGTPDAVDETITPEIYVANVRAFLDLVFDTKPTAKVLLANGSPWMTNSSPELNERTIANNAAQYAAYLSYADSRIEYFDVYSLIWNAGWRTFTVDEVHYNDAGELAMGAALAAKFGFPPIVSAGVW